MKKSHLRVRFFCAFSCIYAKKVLPLHLVGGSGLLRQLYCRLDYVPFKERKLRASSILPHNMRLRSVFRPISLANRTFFLHISEIFSNFAHFLCAKALTNA